MTADLAAASGVIGDHNVTVTGTNGSVSLHFGPSGPPPPPRLRRQLPMDLVRELERVFVRGPGHSEVERALRNPGAVVVCGQPGVGRRTSALIALGHSGDPDAGFRELPDDSPDGGQRLDADAVEPGERLLLDLTADPPPRTDRFWSDLVSYRAAVQQKGAYLAIVLPAQVRHAELGARVELGRPDGREVLRRHLAAGDVPVPHFTDSALVKQVAHEPMRELAELAGRIRRVRDGMGGAGGWADWLTPALAAAEAHRDVVAERVGALRDGRARALLLAAAVFDGARPEVVALGAEGLLEEVGYPDPDEHRLDRPDLGESLRPLRASIRDGAVRFESLTYAEAVRAHFWTTFPELRPGLRAWLDGFLRDPVAERDRVRTARRVARSLIDAGHAADVVALVDAWAELWPMTGASTAALVVGLEDDQHGQLFRARVYDWAVQRTHPALATALVSLCANVIAPTRPQQALVRLRHLARHDSSTVSGTATTVLGELSERDGHFARRLLHLLHEDLTGPYRREVNPAHFLAAADPARLTGTSKTHPRLGEPHTRAMVTQCWTALLATATDLADAIAKWLSAGDDALLDCLADAVRDKPVLVARLYAVTRDWATADPEERRQRATTAARLRHASTQGENQ